MILTQIGLEDFTIFIPDTWNGDALPAGHVIGTPRRLFTKIPVERVEEWRKVFLGRQVVREKGKSRSKEMIFIGLVLHGVVVSWVLYRNTY